MWNYHVILLRERANAWNDQTVTVVLDMDTRLKFPCDLNEYLRHSFSEVSIRPADAAPLFRIVDAKHYLNLFSSNRAAATSKVVVERTDGSGDDVAAATPPYACIQKVVGEQSTLYRFCNMKNDEENLDYGNVLTLAGLEDRFIARK
jgi:hypothetical protein